jgi:hypothetical protein
MDLPLPLSVPDQAHPDPEFPTTPFPNPEEGEGVWEYAYDLGAWLLLFSNCQQCSHKHGCHCT